MKVFRHLKTIRTHRKAVRKLCFECGLYWQGITHDLSKYSPTEFINGVKYYTGTCSPHVGERKAKGHSDAWLHHKGCNKHHSDYWVDIVDGVATPIDMPPRYFVEMLCDRIAASKTYLKDAYTDAAPYNYLTAHKDENAMSKNTYNLAAAYLAILARRGEEFFFDYIKDYLQVMESKNCLSSKNVL